MSFFLSFREIDRERGNNLSVQDHCASKIFPVSSPLPAACADLPSRGAGRVLFLRPGEHPHHLFLIHLSHPRICLLACVNPSFSSVDLEEALNFRALTSLNTTSNNSFVVCSPHPKKFRRTHRPWPPSSSTGGPPLACASLRRSTRWSPAAPSARSSPFKFLSSLIRYLLYHISFHLLLSILLKNSTPHFVCYHLCD